MDGLIICDKWQLPSISVALDSKVTSSPLSERRDPAPNTLGWWDPIQVGVAVVNCVCGQQRDPTITVQDASH